jgi:phosphoglycolate phosphatase-like HAD superfamily hydrolase
MTHAIRTVLITDLDDTLWDWLNIWYSSFYPMFQEIVRITGTSEDELIPVIKKIHEQRGTSEYSFLLQDLESHYGRPSDFATVRRKYDTATHAFRRGRKDAQQLLPGALETLKHIKARGAKLVGYTESMAFATIQRLKAFELDGVLDILYSPQDHDYPQGLDLDHVRSLESTAYKLQKTVHHHTAPGELKPNVKILESMIKDMGANKDDCVYVGDKKLKDIAMARDAGVLDAWAQYGNKIHTAEYAFLKRVTHWTPKAVSDEATKDVPATITLKNSFAELLNYVRFERFNAS